MRPGSAEGWFFIIQPFLAVPPLALIRRGNGKGSAVDQALMSSETLIVSTCVKEHYLSVRCVSGQKRGSTLRDQQADPQPATAALGID